MQGIKAGVLGLALSSFIGNAWAADVCARAQDLTALQAAAVQQELVVAAFTCNDFGLYNSFVIAYQKDLQESDAALQAFFLRLNAATGTADYHTFKTKLANSYSLRSTGNTKAYCGVALRIFHAALNEGKKTLAEFALSQPVLLGANYDSCGERIPGGAMIAQTAARPGPPLTSSAAATVFSAVTPTLPAATPAADEAAPSILAAKSDSAKSNSGKSDADEPLPAAGAKYSAARSGPVYAARDSEQSSAPPPLPRPAPQVRRTNARDRYTRDPYDRSTTNSYGDSYGYSNRYGDRDPYYRNPYDRYWYGAEPQYYYLRRR